MTRSFNKLHSKNTISLDEKVFAPRKYSQNRVTVCMKHVGYVPSPKMPYSDKHFFTLQMAITSDRILHYNIIDGPSTIETFNEFLLQMHILIPLDGIKRFVVLDNGHFHQLFYPTYLKLLERNVYLCFNAPLACFLNPIEEVF